MTLREAAESLALEYETPEAIFLEDAGVLFCTRSLAA